ncbi:hypothetical protein KBD59_02290 [Candidatus Gracilibacteria bacterium]|nr:hypothetical protein [Candidatus Gracilibacteria bacterium]
MGFEQGNIESNPTPALAAGQNTADMSSYEVQCFQDIDATCKLASDSLPQAAESTEGKRIDFKDPQVGRVSVMIPPNCNGQLELFYDGKGQSLEASMESQMKIGQRAQEAWKKGDQRAFVVIEGNMEPGQSRYGSLALEGVFDRVINQVEAKTGSVKGIRITGASLGGEGAAYSLTSKDAAAKKITEVTLLDAAYKMTGPALNQFARDGGKLNVIFMDETTGYTAGKLKGAFDGKDNVRFVHVDRSSGDLKADHKKLAQDYYGTFLGAPLPDTPQRPPQIVAQAPIITPEKERVSTTPSSYAVLSPDGNSYKIDYNGNAVAAKKLGMGEMLPADVLSVEVRDANGVVTCAKAIRVPGLRGFRDEKTHKYVPVKQDYAVNVLEKRFNGNV